MNITEGVAGFGGYEVITDEPVGFKPPGWDAVQDSTCSDMFTLSQQEKKTLRLRFILNIRLH